MVCAVISKICWNNYFVEYKKKTKKRKGKKNIAFYSVNFITLALHCINWRHWILNSWFWVDQYAFVCSCARKRIQNLVLCKCHTHTHAHTICNVNKWSALKKGKIQHGYHKKIWSKSISWLLFMNPKTHKHTL